MSQNKTETDNHKSEINAICSRIDFLLCCLVIHSNQIMGLTENYIDYLAQPTKDIFFPEKKQLFKIFSVIADYVHCIGSLRHALTDDTEDSEAKIRIHCYRHTLVLQIANRSALDTLIANV